MPADPCHSCQIDLLLADIADGDLKPWIWPAQLLDSASRTRRCSTRNTPQGPDSKRGTEWNHGTSTHVAHSSQRTGFSCRIWSPTSAELPKDRRCCRNAVSLAWDLMTAVKLNPL